MSITKEEVNEVVRDTLDRQHDEYIEWLRDGIHMASSSSWINSTADSIAFDIMALIKEPNDKRV